MWTIFIAGIVIGVGIREGMALVLEARDASRLALLADKEERRKQQQRQTALDRLRDLKRRDTQLHRLPVRRDGHARPLGAA